MEGIRAEIRCSQKEGTALLQHIIAVMNQLQEEASVLRKRSRELWYKTGRHQISVGMILEGGIDLQHQLKLVEYTSLQFVNTFIKIAAELNAAEVGLGGEKQKEDGE
jgi:hypothetical protein